MQWTRTLGYIPSIIFPAATITQLWTLWQAGRSDGASALTWTLFGIANLCLYLYVEKYREPQAIIGLLGTAVVDFAIVAVILRYRTLGV
ncbi:MAG: hypothetical protein C0483_23040 [Pirellula sp.]|nr:hypothetical protein [Pirellula sp.]